MGQIEPILKVILKILKDKLTQMIKMEREYLAAVKTNSKKN